MSYDPPLVICVIQGHSPSPEPRVDAGAQEKANQLWTELLQSKEPREFMVHASSLASYGRKGSQQNCCSCEGSLTNIPLSSYFPVECKTAFSQPSFRADRPIELCVHLRCVCVCVCVCVMGRA